MFYLSRHVIKIIEGESVVIENINKVNSFDDKLVSIDNFILYGKDLQITSIEDGRIVIKGEMEKFEVI